MVVCDTVGGLLETEGSVRNFAVPLAGTAAGAETELDGLLRVSLVSRERGGSAGEISCREEVGRRERAGRRDQSLQDLHASSAPTWV